MKLVDGLSPKKILKKGENSLVIQSWIEQKKLLEFSNSQRKNNPQLQFQHPQDKYIQIWPKFSITFILKELKAQKKI